MKHIAKVEKVVVQSVINLTTQGFTFPESHQSSWEVLEDQLALFNMIIERAVLYKHRASHTNYTDKHY